MSALYEQDFYSWCLDQATALRSAAHLRINTAVPVDWEHLAEEIEDLGRSRARELRSRYTILLLHLLKWLYQPEARSRSWQATIAEQRDELQQVLAENPGLKPGRAESFASAYASARKRAAIETGLDPVIFPEACPFTIEEAQDDAFWPEPAGSED